MRSIDKQLKAIIQAKNIILNESKKTEDWNTGYTPEEVKILQEVEEGLLDAFETLARVKRLIEPLMEENEN